MKILNTKSTKTTLLLSSLLSIPLLSAPITASATGMHQCEPISEDAWLSEAEVTAIMTDQGWEVSRMKKDGGCWEVYGHMPDGKFVEAYIAPDTGEIVLISQRGTILFEK